MCVKGTVNQMQPTLTLVVHNISLSTCDEYEATGVYEMEALIDDVIDIAQELEANFKEFYIEAVYSNRFNENSNDDLEIASNLRNWYNQVRQ